MLIHEREDKLVNILKMFLNGYESTNNALSSVRELGRFSTNVNLHENCHRFTRHIKMRGITESDRRSRLFADVAGIEKALRRQRNPFTSSSSSA
jgi:hypothetical protein